MYGLAAIEASNGWAIAVVGLTIVFTSLITLSLLISQLHKAVDLFEHPEKIVAFFKGKEKAGPDKPQVPTRVFTEEQKQAAEQIALLVRTMEDHFSLPRLLRLAEVSGIKHPYENLDLLLHSGIVYPDKEGLFCWDPDLFETTISY